MPKWAGCAVRREAAIDSTNRAARQWAREGAPHGAVVIAGEQTAGRGRRGRGWVSAPGAGLWLSIIVRPSLPDDRWPLLPLAAALAGADACGAGVLIKWPNDLILDGRKIAGILAEREGDAAVIGIGINVGRAPEDFPEDLREKAGALPATDMRALEQALLAALENRIDNMDFLPEYAARCATVGARVRVEAADGTYLALAEGIDPDGALRVRDDAGAVRRVLAGDVSVRGLMGYAP